ncbi:MAG: Glycosyl transferase family 2 [Candidatus Gottesmanbacteria bacterium GW2011_GWA2_47_9]|uniref:Glycosyl transferase family 2 n=2 Tax=Candidatus Gottesmaniibacteriota TaxID=1752720 RepID=A0A0G1UPK8_9BACT|nr:MAG: Glycosyl transferase family 2 [Candidatus Gottesmanbacteria bacterium GW2011_GWA2_47_9]KKU96084.1 MAG: Glycosyl transferase family 2 [Candidatus Gottesmanbacteria bacterium GW2011_GWA1_48_13]
MKISVIIPVYNNARTVGRVIAAAKAHPSVAEVIVVCDASQDGSEKVLEKLSGIRLIKHAKRQGKGGAVVAGWKAAKHDVILGLDADLAGVTPDHIDQLIRMFETGKWDMVIEAGTRLNPFAWVGGTRIYRKHVVFPYRSLAIAVGYGIEQVINYAHKEKRVHMIYLPDMGHERKYYRHAPHRAAWLYAKEGWELVRTEYRLGFPVTRDRLSSARGFIVGLNFLRGMTKYF